MFYGNRSDPVSDLFPRGNFESSSGKFIRIRVQIRNSAWQDTIYNYLVEDANLYGAKENLDDGTHRCMVVDATLGA